MIEKFNAPLAHPTLYGAGTDGVPVILAGRCTHCGRVGFPRQAYGCEACGAHGAALADVDLPADTPFVMAEVRLDGGPLLRATLAPRRAVGLEVGARLRGMLVAGDRPGAALELRFAPVEG
jgi:uncharacterized OB-fold protein